jgi:hypothetical protein
MAPVSKKARSKKGSSKKGRKPKSTCCVSDKRCQRCPIRMLKDGTLPQGYTVKKRKLVKAA